MRFVCILAAITILSAANLAAIIKDIDTMEQARPYVFEKPKTLVCFDVDDTLLKLKTNVPGTPEFQKALVDYALSQGVDHPSFHDTCLWPMYKPRYECPEEATKTLVNDLLTKNIPTIVLTARAPYMWRDTVNELSAAGLDFSLSTFGKEHRTFDLYSGSALLIHGMLLTGSPDKFAALCAFLQATDYRIERIVCIDDAAGVLKWLDSAFSSRQNTEFIGLRYVFLAHAEPEKIEIPQRFKDVVASAKAAKFAK